MSSCEWSRLLNSLYWVLKYCSCWQHRGGCDSLPGAELRRMAERPVTRLAVWKCTYRCTLARSQVTVVPPLDLVLRVSCDLCLTRRHRACDSLGRRDQHNHSICRQRQAGRCLKFGSIRPVCCSHFAERACLRGGQDCRMSPNAALQSNQLPPPCQPTSQLPRALPDSQSYHGIMKRSIAIHDSDKNGPRKRSLMTHSASLDGQRCCLIKEARNTC